MKAKIFFLFFSLLILQNCKNNTSKSEELQTELKKINIVLNSNITTLFILTDNDCYSCNKKFSVLLKEKLNDRNSLIILNSKGLIYDISEFKNKKNVIKINSSDSFFQKTKIIKLRDTKIVSDIQISIKNIDDLKI
ncbi:hypothetical protein [Flavobacterium sp.]|uniref:hypothetical protein n=1 Tax=Flavobacterium sp. TaxID=239 RepID=UPI0040489FAB